MDRHGVLNVLPDAISRIYDDNDKVSVSEELAIFGIDCTPRAHGAPVSELQESTTGKWSIIDIMEPLNGKLVPEIERKPLLETVHSMGHFGATAMFKVLVKQGKFWPSMRADCLSEVQKCLKCQRFNIGQRGFHPLSSIMAQLPMDHVMFDLKEFPLSGKGNKYMLVVIDVATRFIFLRCLPNKAMLTVAESCFKLFCDIGFPKILQSDQGKEFVNGVVHEIVKIAKIDRRLITAYNPRADGLVERFVGSSSAIIYKQLEGRDSDWDLYVPSAQLFLNSKQSERTLSTPFALMFGRSLNGFSNYSNSESHLLNEEDLLKRILYMTEIVYPEISKNAEIRAKKQQDYFNSNHRIVYFAPGSQVMVVDELRSQKSQPRYTGPMAVLKVEESGTYVLKGPDGTIYKRPPHMLKQIHQEVLVPDQRVAVSRVLSDRVDLEGKNRTW